MASKPRKIARKSIPESVRDSLCERILSGEFKEGDALIQDAIAEEYDVSRMPVREALRQLEAMGLIAMRTHHGAIVTTIPTEQVQELHELRALLEAESLAHALPRMTDQDLAEAQQVLDQLEASYRSGDMAGWGRLNWQFHRRLYLPANRPQTLAILDNINLQTERYVRMHLVVTGGFDEAEREHRELLRLCMLRDAPGAIDYLRHHILDAGRALVENLRASRAAH